MKLHTMEVCCDEVRRKRENGEKSFDLAQYEIRLNTMEWVMTT